MTTRIIKWTTGLVIGLSLFAGGCGEKRSDSDTSQSRVGAADSSPKEQSAPDDKVSPSGGSEQSPADNHRENTGG
jgi:hypothetical protein